MPIKTCALCGKKVLELCDDRACRACHESCSWEDCTTGTFRAEQLLKLGYPADEVQRLCPNAKPEKED